MSRSLSTVIAIVLGLWPLLCAAQKSGPEDLVAQGRGIYMRGVLPNAASLSGTGAAGSVLTGSLGACVNCHHRSGMGGREGELRVAPITGATLFVDAVPFRPMQARRGAIPPKPSRQASRHAYDDASLLRAIREGIDADGNALHQLMPRYALDDASGRAIVAYLRQLSVSAAPGVEQRMLHLATVVTPDADETRSKTAVNALTAWAQGGALGGMPLTLHVWRLVGPSETWAHQLEAAYQRQPVYAVLSGTGGTQWAPIHEFCERTALACLFPIVDSAPSDASDFYNLYFSTGIPTEARLLTKYLTERSPAPRRVIQFVGSVAAQATSKPLDFGSSSIEIETRAWDADHPGKGLSDLHADDVVVGWLSPTELKAMAEAWPLDLRVSEVLLSAQLASPEGLRLPKSFLEMARWVSVRSDPARRQGYAVIGLIPWAAHLHLSPTDDPVLGDVYAATYFFGDALARMRGLWTREFLMETLETAEYNRAAGGGYFSLSSGSGQREVVKSGYLLGFSAPAYLRIEPISLRLTP